MVLPSFRLTRKRVLLVIILLAAVSPLIYYLASPLFISRAVDDPAPTAETVTLATGTFTGADSFHRVSGTAMVLLLEDGSRALRLESLDATRGPDLFVYLSTEKTARDFVNLGELKGNLGDQNHNVPVEVDLARHRFVLIWCRAFSVLFGSAELA